MIEESHLRILSKDDLPEDVHFIFINECTIGSSELVNLKMSVRRLGQELILEVHESTSKENLKNGNYETYYKDKLKKLYNRQQQDFDLIVEDQNCNMECMNIKYSLILKNHAIEMVLRLSDCTYKAVKLSVQNYFTS